MIAYVTELNDGNYQDVINRNEFVLVDVSATWCVPCQTLSPVIDELSAEYRGRILVGKLDADSNREIITSLSIRNIPAVFFYKNWELVEKSIGFIDKQKLVEMINNHL